MFMTKKKKVRLYLENKPKEKYTAFDLLLIDYLNGSFEKRLKTLGLKWNNVQIQWDDDYQWINVESGYHGYTMDLTIYSDEIVIFFLNDRDLPEDLEPNACKEQDLPLESKEQVFDLIAEKLAGLE